MTQDMNESTRVMPAAPAAPDDRTMVAGGAPAAVAPPAGATQMGATIACPVCRTSNSGMETYCGECGFLLASAPGQADEAPPDAEGGVELIENTSGRRFKLRPGANTVGRENADIMLIDGTVSRRHAQVDVDGGQVSVTDFGSTNGTQVNGVRIAANEATPVPLGATVRFGNATLTLPDPSAPEATIVTAPAAAAADATLVGVPAGAEQTMVGAPPVAGAAPTAAPAAAGIQAQIEESAEPAMARLKPTNDQAHEIPLRSGTTSIGRRAGNTVAISGDPYVSGRHAELRCDNTGCYITDVGSTNGTVVNGQKLEPNAEQLLLDGDEIGLGQGTYLFETLEAPEPDESVAQPADAGDAQALQLGETPADEGTEA